MKRILLSAVALLAASTFGFAQMPEGMTSADFAGFNFKMPTLESGEQFKDVAYVPDGNVAHTLDIYLPKEKKASYPVAIHIYGSAWYSNNSKFMANLDSICQALVDAGYAVVTPNHRSSGDGPFPAQINDIKSVIRFLRANAKQYKLDTSFIAISGFSSGGHLSSLAGTTSNVKKTKVGSVEVDLEGEFGPYINESSAVDCVVDWSGPIDLLNMECEWERPWGGTPEEALMATTYRGHQHDDLFSTINPIQYLDPSDPPVIIFHGTKDNVVPHCQGVELYDACVKAGLTTDLNLVEGAGHGIKLFEEPWLSEMVEFVNAAKEKKLGK